MMHGHGQSDSPVVPTKFPNKAGEPAAEGMEGRGLAKGNPSQHTAPRAQDRVGALSALERVRQVAERDKPVRFTTLLHHVYHIDHLRRAYYALKREAAPGIDGETWQHYGEALGRMVFMTFGTPVITFVGHKGRLFFARDLPPGRPRESRHSLSGAATERRGSVTLT
jgi:hypothetical protein